MYCIRCGHRVEPPSSYSEEGTLDFPWCDFCTDFTDGVSEPPTRQPTRKRYSYGGFRVECSRKIRFRFTFSALGSYPKEAYAVLFGRRTGRLVQIKDLWWPEDQSKYTSHVATAALCSRPPWVRKAEDIAESEGLEIVGDIHSHPDTVDVSPSTPDWGTNKADWVMGICSVRKQKREFRTSIAFWYGRPRMRTRWT